MARSGCGSAAIFSSTVLSPSACTASFRTAVILTLMETALARASSATRQTATVGFVRFLAIPGKELVQAQVVHPFGDRGGDGIEH
jgi:hypothetical protein